MDRHHSHVTSNSGGLCSQNDLNLDFLPFHTLDITQYLGIEFSGPSKLQWLVRPAHWSPNDPCIEHDGELNKALLSGIELDKTTSAALEL